MECVNHKPKYLGSTIKHGEVVELRFVCQTCECEIKPNIWEAIKQKELIKISQHVEWRYCQSGEHAYPWFPTLNLMSKDLEGIKGTLKFEEDLK